MVFQLTLWQSQWHDGALSKLNVAIEALNRTKEVLSVTPAKPVFDSVRVLLTVIRVYRLLFCGNGVLAHVYPGLKRTRLRRAWAELR